MESHIIVVSITRKAVAVRAKTRLGFTREPGGLRRSPPRCVRAEPVQAGRQPAAPRAEIEDGVADAKLQGVQHQAEPVQDARRVLDRAERLVERVLASLGLGRDLPPVSFCIVIELIGWSQELGSP